jgi:thiol:disulfide interchange protein DsbD
MIRKIGYILLTLFLTLISISVNADGLTKQTENTTVNLFYDGKDSLLIRMRIRDGWHIYWDNPGEIGKPTKISSDKPENLSLLNQSLPLIETSFDIMDEYVYRQTVYYLYRLKTTENTVISLNFVECNNECKNQNLSFTLDNLAPTPKAEWESLKKQAELTFPQKIKLNTNNNSVFFTQSGMSDKIKVIPMQYDVVEPDSLYQTAENNGWLIGWQPSGEAKLQDLLIITPQKSFLAEINYDTVTYTLLYMLLAAFIGGILLNAMPCVFPILSLKIFSLINNANSTKHNYARAFGYICGVVSSFMLLTAILVFLKTKGEAIGWGFQLQSPWFVGIMAFIFVLLFLFMTDILTFPEIAADKLNKLSAANSFSTGFFAVLIASPCTGPFMGAAIGYAFMQSNEVIFAVFTALALGYALPYAAIEAYPNALIGKLPRPGKWMRTVKIILAIPMLLTAIWLFSVLLKQTGETENNRTIAADELNWQTYNAEQITLLVAQNEKVFIDFTADWCLTCRFNDKLLLQSDKFKNFVKEENIYLFKADMTEYDESYEAALATYERDSIPAYIYYHNGSYKVLPLFFGISDFKD